MDFSPILQILRDLLTVVGASKLVYEGYRQIKKTLSSQRTGKSFQNTGTQIAYYLNRLYKKALGVRPDERFVRHSLQKKPTSVGIPGEIAGSPVTKKASINRNPLIFDQNLFLKKTNSVIFHRNRVRYLQACQ